MSEYLGLIHHLLSNIALARTGFYEQYVEQVFHLEAQLFAQNQTFV